MLGIIPTVWRKASQQSDISSSVVASHKPVNDDVLGRSGRISRGILDCCNLISAMDELPRCVATLANRIGNDCIVPVTMP